MASVLIAAEDHIFVVIKIEVRLDTEEGRAFHRATSRLLFL